MPFQKTINNNLRHGIAVKFFVLVVCAATIIIVITTFVHLCFTYKNSIDDINVQLLEIKNSYLEVMTSYAWVANNEILQTQLNGLAKLPNIQYLQLKLETSPVITAGEQMPAYDITREYPLIHNYRGRDITLGSLQINISFAALKKSTFAAAFEILLTQAITILIISGLILYLFNLLVGKHLNKMARYTQSLTLDKLDLPLSLDRSEASYNCQDELSLLCNSINSMRESLIADIDKRELAEESLKKAYAEIEIRVQERTASLSIAKEKLKDEIHERKIIYESLRKEQVLLKAVLENIEDGIVVCDEYGILSLFNRATKELHGLPETAISPDDWAQHYSLYLANGITPMQKEDIPLFRAFKGEHFKDIEFVIAPEHTARRVLLASGRPLLDDAGHKQGAVVSVHDITERKEIEETLKKSHDDLEKEVQHRTIELQQSYGQLEKEATERAKLESQLRQSHKMEAIGTMAGGIAHDFNNILAAVIGYADMAMDGVPKSSPAKQHLEQVLIAGNRAKDLVRQILTFSRMSNLTQGHSPIQLSPIVKEVIKFQRSIFPTTISIVSDIDESCGEINADSIQIHQVVMNFCTNALHAMETQGGTLKIILKRVGLSLKDLKSESDLAPGDYINLSVSDTGTGISAGLIEKIFDPYFTTKKVGKGSGMGLSVVQGIVKNHGGFVKVVSELGKGSTFSAFFPFSKEEVPSLDNGEAASIPTGTERILFIDDEEVLANVGKAILERLGYSVTSETDSTAALALFQKDPTRFDVVITDQTMPKISGSILAKKLLQIRPDIPIILCTGYNTMINEVKAREIGIREYAMKPVEKSVMAQLIRKVLDT